MPNSIQIDVFIDGEETPFLDDIKALWINRWAKNYSSLGTLCFNSPVNVKGQAGIAGLPPNLTQAFEIRNPDIFFTARLGGEKIALGGIEITVHSPDGSNVEKRYPFIWAGRKHDFTAFVVSPYMKTRAGGQVNKLPNRHSARNLDFIDEWMVKASPVAPLHQIIPIMELQEDYESARKILKVDLLPLADLSGYFCDLLAEKIKPKSSENRISKFVFDIKKVATACKSVTRYTKPSSFIEQGNRWIQIYNTRPDSGHWERGEGQFDSIDGRLMFTLDEAEIKGLDKALEFWMPQLSSGHAWVVEQVERDHGSKRLRNIVKVLSKYMKVKFADDLTPDDLKILQNNPGLTLERLDWASGILHIAALVGTSSPAAIARAGLKSPSSKTVSDVQRVLESNTTFISTHRLYETAWAESFKKGVLATPSGSTVLAPRIPESQFSIKYDFGNRQVFFAGDCTKAQLMAIRQLHRQCFE
jgi:hypothetical protein